MTLFFLAVAQIILSATATLEIKSKFLKILRNHIQEIAMITTIKDAFVLYILSDLDLATIFPAFHYIMKTMSTFS